MSQICDVLRQEIDANGPISFARFMAVALYCPNIGYYEREPAVIGSGGDFYTSASLGPALGQLLAWQFSQWSESLGADRIAWVEAGAHDGTLALTMLEWLGKNRPAFFERLTYCIIEPSSTRRLWQEQKLRPYQAKVRWAESLEDLVPIDGIIFSNELLDAFPVHRVAWDAFNRRWCEWGVSLRRRGGQGENEGVGGFVWVKLPAPSFDIVGELDSAGFTIPPPLLDVLPDGFIIELAPSARIWWGNAAKLLARGKLLTIDYGGTADELLRPERTGGTLRGYLRHHVSADVLARPGEQDLTAHVNFTQLQRSGEEAGLKTEALVSQEIFLSRILQSLSASTVSDAMSRDQFRKLQPLIHPEHFGHSFRVLIQSDPGVA
jgi:SAM-dependent MidA family methyltransferase